MVTWCSFFFLMGLPVATCMAEVPVMVPMLSQRYRKWSASIWVCKEAYKDCYSHLI